MKNFIAGWYLANDYNFAPEFSKDEFKLSLLHGIGYNIGTLYRKLFKSY
jgi:hypothetical protein